MDYSYISLSLSLSLSDLHSTKLTHTDLKPENILFVSSDYDIYYDARRVSTSAVCVCVRVHVCACISVCTCFVLCNLVSYKLIVFIVYLVNTVVCFVVVSIVMVPCVSCRYRNRIFVWSRAQTFDSLILDQQHLMMSTTALSYQPDTIDHLKSFLVSS